MPFRPYPLPDGRVLLARVADELGGGSHELGPLWELQIEGRADEVLSGHPLNSSLADLLGWQIAHEEWPEWVDQLASQIESDLT